MANGLADSSIVPEFTFAMVSLHWGIDQKAMSAQQKNANKPITKQATPLLGSIVRQRASSYES